MEMFKFFETDDLDFRLHKGEEGPLYVSITDDNGTCNSVGKRFDVSLGDFYKISAPDVINAFEFQLADALTTPSETGNLSNRDLDKMLSDLDGLAKLAANLDGLDGLDGLATNVPSADEIERRKRLARLMKARFAADNERPQA